MISEFHLFLEQFPLFQDIPPLARSELEQHLEKESFSPHHRVVAEGSLADRLYFILEGTAEVLVEGEEGPVVVASLGPGEMFGEIALLQDGSRRSATILSTSPLTVLSLDGGVFQTSLAKVPEAKWSFQVAAQDLLLYNFLKLTSPFRTLHPGQLKALIKKLERRSVPQDAIIIRQGEIGEACFLLRSGRVEVVCREDSGADRVLATLPAGSLFGEIALLTDTPRNATVRAFEPCELLVLHRHDLLAILGEADSLGGLMMDLLCLRERPKAVTDIQVQHRTTADGESLVILKNDQNQSYYQLTSSGWFIWQQLNGQHTLRDLTLAYFEKFATFAPHMISETISRLGLAGFLARGGRGLLSVVPSQGQSWRQKIFLKVAQIVQWRLFYRGIDPCLGRLYQGLVHWLYTRTGQWFLVFMGLGGLGIFFTHWSVLPESLKLFVEVPYFPFLILPMIFIGILVHEAAHAFTVKYFGRQVHGAGLGWHWVSPVFFVDTSDMWMAERWPRILVSLAGPYANFLLGSLASLMTVLPLDRSVSSVLVCFALGNYLTTLTNLIPLFHYDGHYALQDFKSRL